MSTGFTFGAKSTTPAPAFGSTNLSFGTPITQTGGLTFGAPSAGAAPSLFGTPTPTAPTTTTSLFGATPAATGLFGTPAATAAPNLSFGLNPATATSTGLTFAALSTASVAPPSFGLAISTTATSLGAATTSSAPSFGIGLTSTTSAPATTTGALNFSLGGLTSTSLASTSLTPATTPSTVGLGGISTNLAKGAVTTRKEVPPKDQALPNEILQTVEGFKNMVKLQKSHSSDISRCSVRDFRRVEQQIDQLSSQLNELENQLLKHRHIAEKLKYDTAKTVQNVEMAQRTHDTPPGLQYENTAPMKFFLNLADQFERDMQNLKIQIEAAEKYVKSHKNPDSLSPQDLAQGMRRLHETFVALAGRLQSVHSQVESQKETYLNIRKHLLQDASNPFDKLPNAPGFHISNVHNAFIHSPPKVATGPTPFNNLAFRSVRAGAPQQQNTPPPAYPGFSTNTGSNFGSTTFGASAVGSQPSNTSLLGSTGFGQTSYNSFQLQKPPTGNKRGKI